MLVSRGAVHAAAAVTAVAALLCLATTAAAAAAPGEDRDFEFDDNQESVSAHRSRLRPARPARPARPRRYVYDPNNALCAAVSCGARSACVVSRGGGAGGGGRRARCVPRDRLRSDTMPESADNVVSEEDVFYEAHDDLDHAAAVVEGEGEGARCVGCGGEAEAEEGGGFLCGSDNRTYSSLCRLDLHNCVRRASPPVTLACRGFCPCVAPHLAHPTPPAQRPARPRARAQRRKHDKFRQYTHEASRRRRLEMSHNEVLPGKDKSRPRLATEAERATVTTAECSLESMASRLLDWFAVLMEQAGAGPGALPSLPPLPPLPSAALRDDDGDDEFPGWCPREVRWMFSHLDSDGDGLLSADNLYALQHDERERCLRPFLASCGADMPAEEEEGMEGEEEAAGRRRRGGGEGATRAAWCGCLRRGARPCARLARAHPHPPPGSYVPRCDAAGWYLPRQCHSALRLCWCVDRRGVERPGSRARGRVRCDPAPPLYAELEEVVQRKQEIALSEDVPGVGAGQGAPADDEDGGAGSGAGDLLY